MRIEDVLGRFAELPVERIDARGAWLSLEGLSAQDAHDALLLPLREVPDAAHVGGSIDVFVYLDSDDAPAATTKAPRIALQEVAFLEVTDLAPFGAFVDWGLGKELLVPTAEHTRPLRIGEYHPIGLYIDATGRLAGTMRVREMLQSRGDFVRGEWVEGEAWRNEPGLGLFVIVERGFLGLVPEREPHTLRRGQPARFRIANVRDDGKIELSLRRLAHEEIDDDAQRILDVLSADRTLAIGDGAPAEAIREHFGMGKKAFKRAVGRLLKEGDVLLDDRGHVRLRSL